MTKKPFVTKEKLEELRFTFTMKKEFVRMRKR